MRRLVTRWALLLVFVLVLGGTFVRLGQWQWHRLEHRRAMNATILMNQAAPIRPFDEVFTRTIVDADQWQRVHARGEFDAAHQFEARYRSNNGEQGLEVVTPLRTDAGVNVLVSRGFIARVKGEPTPATLPPPPTGEVEVVGYVRRDEQGKRVAITPVDGKLRLINAPAIGATLPYPLVDGYIAALTVEPPQEGSFTPVALPELSDGPHFWYAVQWWTFCGLAVAGLVVFIRRDVLDLRAAQSRFTPGRRPTAPQPLASPSPTKEEAHGSAPR